MTNIIEHAYTALANTGELDLTEKDYSTNYLGRCKSYYAYLKSTGKQPSTEVLLQLWTQLRLAEKQEKTKNKSNESCYRKLNSNMNVPSLKNGRHDKNNKVMKKKNPIRRIRNISPNSISSVGIPQK